MSFLSLKHAEAAAAGIGTLYPDTRVIEVSPTYRKIMERFHADIRRNHRDIFKEVRRAWRRQEKRRRECLLREREEKMENKRIKRLKRLVEAAERKISQIK